MDVRRKFFAGRRCSSGPGYPGRWWNRQTKPQLTDLTLLMVLLWVGVWIGDLQKALPAHVSMSATYGSITIYKVARFSSSVDLAVALRFLP